VAAAAREPVSDSSLARFSALCQVGCVFEGFNEWDIPGADGVAIHGRSDGSGLPVVLLHGHPRTHATWYAVAPLLVAAGRTVVCPDLRGYGRSSTPQPDPGHEVYCDRAMAHDVVAVMAALGDERFSVVGHDRGSYVAYRCALDHPSRVAALAVLDSVPIVEALERSNAHFAERWWHWFFATSHAERVITADPLGWYQLDAEAMGRENYSDVELAITDPATVRAMLEDYRAGLHVDRRHDEEAHAAEQTIACPTLVGWSRDDDMADLYGDLAAVWEPRCSGTVSSGVINTGHHMAEQDPAGLATLLDHFLTNAQP